MKQLISHASGILLFRQLAAANRGGLPFHETLEILSKDPEMFGRDALAVEALSRQLAEGATLSSALQRLPELVSPEVAELIGEVEAKGSLAQTLDAIADDFTELEQRRISIRGALMWPLTVLAAATLLVTMMMIFVIPTFKEMFKNFGADLPAPTLIIMAISDLFVSWWWAIAILIGVFIALIVKNKIPRGLILFGERILFAIPFIRHYLVQAFVSRTVSWIQIAHKDPQLLIVALRYLRASTKLAFFKLCLLNLESRIVNAVPLSQALFDLSPLPNRISLLMQLGEKSKDVDGALTQIVDFSESERIMKLSRFERWFILCTYVVLGLTVGLVVIGMYLPIFKMGQSVG